MADCLIVGGGVVGLSLAYELACRSLTVELIDRQALGREASWAGAGILPPAPRRAATDPLDQLRALSHGLHPVWARVLQEETSIDTGYRESGGIYLARTAGEAAALVGLASSFEELSIEVQKVDPMTIGELEPALQPVAESGSIRAAYFSPGEAQLRNPDHLEALIVACRGRGVTLRRGVEATGFTFGDDRIHDVLTTEGSLRAEKYCICSGAWSYRLLQRLNVETGVLPIRGQMVLFRCPQRLFRCVINEGQRYLVPRDDGRVLVGSTEEEVGFDRSTTDAAVTELAEFARGLVPGLGTAPIEKTWAGLRPASFDGLPYLGRLPGLANAFVAAGHFRSGLHLSTGTAVVTADLICDRPPRVDLSPFNVHRGSAGRRGGVK